MGVCIQDDGPAEGLFRIIVDVLAPIADQQNCRHTENRQFLFAPWNALAAGEAGAERGSAQRPVTTGLIRTSLNYSGFQSQRRSRNTLGFPGAQKVVPRDLQR